MNNLSSSLLMVFFIVEIISLVIYPLCYGSYRAFISPLDSGIKLGNQTPDLVALKGKVVD